MATLRIGKVRPTIKGAFNSVTVYESFDLVSHNGSSYMAMTNIPAGVTPPNSSYWFLYGQRGATGLRGSDGSDGQDGAPGVKGDKGNKGDTGATGATGPRPDHQWSGTSIRFQQASGAYGAYVNLKGDKGDQGVQGQQGATGPRPDHQWDGKSLRFQRADGQWGSYINLQGVKGDKGDKGDRGEQGLPPPASDLLETLKTVDGAGSGLDADKLLGKNGALFARRDGANNFLEANTFRKGIHGTYGADSDGRYGANIWSLGGPYDGSVAGNNYDPQSMYGISWLRPSNAHAVSDVGEGLYVHRAGTKAAAFGHLGSRIYGPLKVTGSIQAVGDVVATGNISGFSDERLKDEIQVIDKSLDKIDQLKGVTYDRIDIKDTRQAGLIAQDVEKVLPEAIRQKVVNGHGESRLALNYNGVVGLLVEGVKSLRRGLKKLQTQVTKNDKQINELLERVKLLEGQNATTN